MKRFLAGALFVLIVAFVRPSSREVLLNWGGEKLHALMPGLANRDSDSAGLETVRSADVSLPNASDLRDSRRTWKLNDGTKLDAVLIAANTNAAQVRLVENQSIYNLGIEDFTVSDREKILTWIEDKGHNGVAGYPVNVKNHAWPQRWQGKSRIPVQQVDNSKVWQTEHFDIVNHAHVDAAAIGSIALICESVNGALSSLPLPLPVNWGRTQNQRRKIIIEGKDSSANIPNAAGYWDSRTGNVHINIEHLFEPDRQSVVFEFDKPKKVQKYDTIVHEVTHQSMAALLYMEVPAWVAEGLAEYMAATQLAPATYQFTNTYVSLRYHINKSVLGDRIVRDRKMQMTYLENLMNRDLNEWISIVESDHSASSMQYDQSLLLVDYFFHADHPDGLHFKRYLEAILSGVSEKDARAMHLVRGRSYKDLEKELAHRWKNLGFTIHFDERGGLQAGDVTINWEAEGIQRTKASLRN